MNGTSDTMQLIYKSKIIRRYCTSKYMTYRRLYWSEKVKRTRSADLIKFYTTLEMRSTNENRTTEQRNRLQNTTVYKYTDTRPCSLSKQAWGTMFVAHSSATPPSPVHNNGLLMLMYSCDTSSPHIC